MAERGAGAHETMWSDLAREAWLGLSARPGRSLATMLGVVVGVGVLAAVLGLTSTAQAAVNRQFDALAVTEVVVADGQPALGTAAYPPDVEARVDRMAGVAASGVLWQVPTGDTSGARGRARSSSTSPSAPVLAASPGALTEAGASPSAGRLLDPLDQHGALDVAVLGTSAARELGVTQVGSAVFVDGVPLTVVGIIGGVVRQPSLLLSVVIPTSTAWAGWGPPSAGAELAVAVHPGAAAVVAGELVGAVRPDDPTRLSVLTDTAPLRIQSQVSSDLTSLFVVIGLVALVVGVIGIAAAMGLSVVERTHEIGLRRALGATRRAVGAQFLVESTILGFVGGVIGTALAVIALAVYAAVRHWTPVVEPAVLVPDPLLGALIGAAAGIRPALRAAAMDPVEALRR